MCRDSSLSGYQITLLNRSFQVIIFVGNSGETLVRAARDATWYESRRDRVEPHPQVRRKSEGCQGVGRLPGYVRSRPGYSPYRRRSRSLPLEIGRQWHWLSTPRCTSAVATVGTLATPTWARSAASPSMGRPVPADSSPARRTAGPRALRTLVWSRLALGRGAGRADSGH